MKMSDEEFDAMIKKITMEGLIICLTGILLQAGLATWLLRTIMKPVDALRLMLMDISQGEGDLTKRNVHQITAVVTMTARGADETATAAAQLSGQAQDLQNLVKQFKL